MAFRSSTAGEQTVLAATFRKTYFRADIVDAAGAWQDYASYAGYSWCESIHIDEHQDQPIAGATIVLRRELDLVGGLGLTTISPLRTDSPANPTGPAATVYRRVKIYMAVVTGSRPSALSTDWKLKFDGVTDRVSMPNDNTCVIACRDKGAYLIDQWTKPVLPGQATRVGQSDLITARGGVSRDIEWVVNELLKYAPITPNTPETVYVPVSVSSVTVTAFPLKFEPVMDALQRVSSLAAADFRYTWDGSTGAYRPTLTLPDRVSPSSVVTLGSSAIVGWKTLDIDRLGVRNYIMISYLPKTTNRRTTIDPVFDAASQASYGTRVLAIQEPDDSPIGTEAEATNLANLILLDLKDPIATAEVEILPDWRIELGDYITFSPNKYFDIAQSLAVVGIRHEFETDDQQTFLTLRGLPSAGYVRWINRAKDLPPESRLTDVDNGISNIQHTDDDDAETRTYTWDRGDNVAFIAFYETLASVPIATSPFPDAADVLSTPGMVILGSATNSWVAVKSHQRGKQRFGIAVPYYKLSGRTVQGPAAKFIVDPLPSALGVFMGTVPIDLATTGKLDNVIAIAGSKSDWPVTIEVWEGDEDGAADFTYTASDFSSDVDSVAMHLKAKALLYERQRVWSVKATNVAGEFVRVGYTEPYRGYVNVSTAVSMDATTATITVTVLDPALFRSTFAGADLSTTLVVDDIAYIDSSPGVTDDAIALNPSYTFVFVIARDVTADFQVTGGIALNLKSHYDPSWSVLDFGPTLIVPPALVPRQ